jgi:hypothetical protein
LCNSKQAVFNTGSKISPPHTLFAKDGTVDHYISDCRLPLESQFKLALVQQQAQTLDVDQLRTCLLAAWSGWLLERHLTARALDSVGVQVDLRVQGYTPSELLAD